GLGLRASDFGYFSCPGVALPSTNDRDALFMGRRYLSRRTFLKTSTALAGLSPMAIRDQTGPAGAAAPLLAYVGTFSSPLRDTLPTQVDLPPGNGSGFHI